MFRRGSSLALLTILAVQILGGMGVAAACFEPCPDDAESESCPPVCVLCASCTHSQSAIVGQSAPGTPLIGATRHLPQRPATAQSRLEADIFHVPLPG